MTTAAVKSPWKPGDTLANRFRLLRAELGYSQRELGERAGIPASQIQSIEDGKSPRGLDVKVLKIAAAVGVDRDWLMWGGSLSDPPAPSNERTQAFNRQYQLRNTQSKTKMRSSTAFAARGNGCIK